MKAHVNDTLFRGIRSNHLLGSGQSPVQSLSEELVNKAHGVFLWVALAVRSLQRGLVNGDSLQTLRRRLQAFPPQLGDFFEHILGQVEDVYKQKTPCLFRVALENTETLKLLAYSFLLEDDPKSVLGLAIKKISTEQFKERRLLAERRLEACCKGLLEIQSSCKDNSETFVRHVNGSEDVISVDSSRYFTNGPDGGANQPHEVVGFLHRTFRGFLLHEHRLWERSLPAGFCPYNFTSLALIGEAKILFQKSMCVIPVLGLVWQGCVSAENCGRHDPDIVDQIYYLINNQLGPTERGQNTASSISFLREVVKKGLVNYLKQKANSCLTNVEFAGPELLEEAFRGPLSERTFKIIA